MNVEMTEAQVQALHRALNDYLSQLEFELARTEQREARMQLRAQYDVLDEIRRHLQQELLQGQVWV